jgi:hypothetical protein
MRVLYVEGDLGSPRFVAGAMKEGGHAVDRVVRADPTPWWHTHDVIVISGTPARGLGDLPREIVAAVAGGRGLLLAAGGRSLWEGFSGSVLADVLPVELVEHDVAGAALFARPVGEHPVVEGLPPGPIAMTGYTRVVPRGHGVVLLEGRVVEPVGEEAAHVSPERVPLLVAGTHVRGRVAVLAGSLAGRWSGGLTDWGDRRVAVDDHDGVGDAYARLVDQLVTWLGTGDATGLTRRPGVGTEAVLSG